MPDRRAEIPILPQRPAQPRPTAPDKALPPPPAVAIVLTGRQPAYDEVALELARRLKNYEIYDLSDKSQPAETAFRLINDSDSGAVIAIGLDASSAAIALSSIPVVYCQVFNYRSNELVTDHSKGVAAVAPLDAQLAAWKKSFPDLNRIGAIIGEDHDDLISEAQAAADRHGVLLTIRIANNDQEAQYQFRRMVAEIDGFWLFPDSRVLSTRSLQEMLTQAQRRQVSIAVTNASMLPLGASISLSAVAANIADTVVDVLRRIEAGQISRIPDISPLSAIQVVIN
jgi:ABC-type uncharacterized transport system substrate-binding protein